MKKLKIEKISKYDLIVTKYKMYFYISNIEKSL